jgi:hypothetical protein
MKRLHRLKAFWVYSLMVVSLALIVWTLMSGYQTAGSEANRTHTTTEMRGLELQGYDEQGNRLDFLIRDQEADPQDPEGEVYLYTVDYKDTNQQWQNLCQADKNFPAKAVVLQGSWDNRGNHIPDQKLVTVSCASGALGKCLRFGYKPWKTLKGESLRNYHQSCFRMVRADYCGDGVGHTRDGTPINVYDRLRIQTADRAPDMSFEAAWGVNGALCINHLRWPDELDYVKQTCSERLATTDEGINRCRTALEAQKKFPDSLLFNDSFVR